VLHERERERRAGVKFTCNKPADRNAVLAVAMSSARSTSIQVRAPTFAAVLDLWLRRKLGIDEGHLMKTKLILALSAALLLSSAAVAAQSDDQSSGGTVQTTRTTTTTVQHLNGANTTWYKEGGVVPTEYRGNIYVVQHWQNEHLNEPAQGSHWVRGDNGDFLLVNENTGAITSISHQQH
jgi:Ni/Co efflux regulator RcnB